LKIQELNSEYHEKENCLQEKIREASRRQSPRNSRDNTETRTESFRVNTD
jgi:hypothetical protein